MESYYIQKQLQFYADKPNQYTNKLFTFKCSTTDDCFRVLLKFAIAGNSFRSAYFNYKFVDGVDKVVSPTNLKKFVDFFNKCEYEKPPSLLQAYNDYLFYYETTK